MPKPEHPNAAHADSLTRGERLSLWVNQRVGTPGMFGLIVGWSAAWLLWNALAPVRYRFDPLPACVLWLLISNMIQLTIMPLLLVGQNLQSRPAALRAEHHVRVSEAILRECRAILARVERWP